MDYKLTNDELKLYDSYKIKHGMYHHHLYVIYNENPDHEIWKCRSMLSMECEWACHNLLYKLGIQRDRTKDVDFELHPKKGISLIYNIFGYMLYIWK